MENTFASISDYLQCKLLQIQKHQMYDPAQTITIPTLESLIYFYTELWHVFFNSTNKGKLISSSVCNQIETSI